MHASVIAEPFGQVVVEAHGRRAGPSSRSDLGGPSEVVTDGVDGLLCPPDDAEALAARMARLASDAAAAAPTSGRRGELRARDFYPEVVAAQVTAAYDEAAGPRAVCRPATPLTVESLPLTHQSRPGASTWPSTPRCST